MSDAPWFILTHLISKPLETVSDVPWFILNCLVSKHLEMPIDIPWWFVFTHLRTRAATLENDPFAIIQLVPYFPTPVLFIRPCVPVSWVSVGRTLTGGV